MARVVTPLSDTKIKKAKAKDKDYTLSDGQGLQLLIKTNGSKLWELFYKRLDTGKRRKTSLGTYPNVSLANARIKKQKYLDLLHSGIDPIENKKLLYQQQKQKEEKNNNTFEKISKEWHKSYIDEVSENYHIKLQKALENYIYPYIKNKPIIEVTRKDVLQVMESLKDKGLHETARRTLQILNKVFMYAVTYEYVPHNIVADIDKKIVLGTRKTNKYPTFTKEEDIKGLLLSIDDYKGEYSTKKALQVLPYVFVRSFNIRYMEWKEIDFKNKLWIIPPEKMKMKIEFKLPLPHQVITILDEVKNNQLSDIYVFPSVRGKDNPMSDNALVSALRRMGFTKEEFVPHSFRSMFSTLANEHLKNSDVIESLLSHKQKDEVRSAYNRAEYLEQKRELIQWYADYLNSLKKAK